MSSRFKTRHTKRMAAFRARMPRKNGWIIPTFVIIGIIILLVANAAHLVP